MNAVASPAQRAKALRNIRHLEREMLPPGWDAGLESQFGTALTAHADHADNADLKPCAGATCQRNNPACAGHCRYQEADRALGLHYGSRPRPQAAKPALQPEPATERRHIDHRARRITWALIALWCAGWIVGPIAWWLFA